MLTQGLLPVHSPSLSHSNVLSLPHSPSLRYFSPLPLLPLPTHSFFLSSITHSTLSSTHTHTQLSQLPAYSLRKVETSDSEVYQPRNNVQGAVL